MSPGTPSRTRSGGDQPHIVIPHNYADHDFSRKLAGALRREGVSPWVEEVDMSAGVILVNRIAHAVRPVDFVIPLISAASLKWRWVEQELKAVAAREFNRRRVRVLPARIDGTALPDYLASQPYVDFHARGWKQAYEDLRAVVQQRTSPRPATLPTPEFELPHAIRRPQPAVAKKAEAKLVFVSYDCENDGYYKDVLLTWAKSPDFPRLSVNDQPVTYPVDSDGAEPLKHVVYGKIKAATAFLLVVGEKTSASAWTDWETKTAIELDKRMIVVSINRDCVAPDVLSEVYPTCALSFTFEGIKRAIDEAYGVIAEE
jgi:hypothetical protein